MRSVSQCQPRLLQRCARIETQNRGCDQAINGILKNMEMTPKSRGRQPGYRKPHDQSTSQRSLTLTNAQWAILDQEFDSAINEVRSVVEALIGNIERRNRRQTAENA